MNPKTQPIPILIVDDRPANLVALESLIEGPDRTIIQAQSGNEALQRVLEADVALVLLDVQMPDMDGFETAELMRLNPATARIPIIFVTAISNEQKHVFKGYESGAVDYISKPIEPLILQSKVNVFCQLYLQRQELEASRQALAAVNEELEKKNQELEEDLQLAQTIQLGFLPDTFPHEDRIAFGREYLICTTLGGDLFDVFSIDEQHVGMYMADVSGHGVSAALISGLLRMSFTSLRVENGHSDPPDLLYPDRVLLSLNRLLFHEIPDDRFITMIYAVLDLATNEFVFASAGHPSPLHYQAKAGSAALLPVPTAPALGLIDIPFPLTRFTLPLGDKLLFYTDGLTEAMNQNRDEFGDENLADTFARHGAEPPAQGIQSIVADIDRHRDGWPRNDDCSLLMVHLTGAETEGPESDP